MKKSYGIAVEAQYFVDAESAQEALDRLSKVISERMASESPDAMSYETSYTIQVVLDESGDVLFEDYGDPVVPLERVP